MNFLDQLKRDLKHPQNRGRNLSTHKVIVSHEALHELLRHFERLDAEARADNSIRHTQQGSFERLHYVTEAAFHHSNKNATPVMLQIMDTLKPLIEEAEKEKAATAHWIKS